ncbi:FCS-Like Zinc finger 8-like [Punica granatum]|uniref:FCS-Like Zinc finger 8-like n=1 Tax=Punica granatum TaxID=22663 RepID=A0A218WVT9_PUNGR|nr:FCS-Like Zinc finger 8-like [Punica granatum]OWM76470.1 hypothetical protein CDL15_Pgr005434 [Punica granatum]
MADSTWSSYFPCGALGLRNWGGPFFAIAGFIIGLAVKGSSRQFESQASPTSHPDFRPFSSSSNTFTAAVDHSPLLQIVPCSKMNFGGIGLGIVSSSAGDAERNSSSRPNQIVFRPHVESISIKCEEPGGKPKFSPEKYRIPSQFLYLNGPLKALSPNEERKAKAPLEQPECELPDARRGKARASLEQPQCELPDARHGKAKPELDKTDSSFSCSNEKKLETKICEPTFSARDIMLSEYYTRITTHGPSPKTTHMFGDMVLECDKKKAPAGSVEDSKAPDLEGSAAADEFLSRCFYCSKKLREDKDIFFCRDKAFCSFQCQCMEILSCGLGERFERSYLENHGCSLQGDQSLSCFPYFPS